MKKKPITKTVLLFSALLILSPAYADAKNNDTVLNTVTVAVSEKNDRLIMPRADVIVWKYKRIGNKMYRRKYNETKKQWIGNWELVS